jgi:hypothetical protein
MQTEPGPDELRAEIARADLRKYSVAAEAGRHPATIARWLSGKEAMPVLRQNWVRLAGRTSVLW